MYSPVADCGCRNWRSGTGPATSLQRYGDMTPVQVGRRVVVVAICGLVAIGCDTSTGGHAQRSATSDSGLSRTSPSRLPPTTPPRSDEPSAKRSVKPPAQPSAIDGSDVSRCADGRCEIAATAGTSIPVPSTTNVRDLRVDRVQRRLVTLSGHILGSTSGGLCTGADCDVETDNDEFTIKMSADSRATENGLSVAAESISGNIVVLRIAPA